MEYEKKKAVRGFDYTGAHLLLPAADFGLPWVAEQEAFGTFEPQYIALKAIVLGRKLDKKGKASDRWEIKVWFDGAIISQAPWYCQTFLDPTSPVRPAAVARGRAAAAADGDEEEEDDDDDAQDSEPSESDDSGGEEEESGPEDDDLVKVKDSRSKCEREWKEELRGIRTDSRTDPKFKPSVVGLTIDAHTDPLDIFLHFWPDGEFEHWAANSREGLVKAGHESASAAEYMHCVGIIFAASLGPRHGGIPRLFSDETSNPLLKGMALGQYGMSRCRFQTLMRYLVIDRDASLDTTIDHSRIKQFADRWNENMKEAFHCGWLVTLDESMLWGHQRNNDHMSFVERKPRALGTEAKCGGDATTRIMTVLELCERADNMTEKPHVKEWGKSVATSLRLCETAGWTESGRVVIGDSWFGSLHFAMMCRQNGMHAIGMVKTNFSGFPKRWLRAHCGKERGDHVVCSTEIDGERYIAVGENDKCIKTFISTCATTLPGAPAHKKRHSDDGKRIADRLVKRTKTSETYYRGMPMVDINNHLRQDGLGLELAFGTHDCMIRQLTSIIGMTEVNSFESRVYFAKFKRSHEENTAALALRMMGGPRLEQRSSPRRHASASRSAVSAASTATSASTSNDVHEIAKFDDGTLKMWNLKSRQQKCVYCLRTTGEHHNTGFYCKKCAGVGSPTHAAICMPIHKCHRQCFALHCANGMPKPPPQRRVGRGLLPHMVAEGN